ncbi:hypothetical protein [Streptacidiphilus neutrinimicus]|uniref:hypothetical protein n=1 Tax=Streptacidiphilus neutrinimicus TaxID=105420 RepID=UPI0005A82F0E|nr:hypothetical protein [Streptacidiphilus neutrinimicus]
MYGPATGPTPPYTPPAAPQPDPYAYPHMDPGFYATAGPAAAPFPSRPDDWFGYGHPVAPQRQGYTAARAGLFLLRVLLTCIPIVSIGVLAWVPLVRTALVRRRTADWIVLAATVVLCTLGFFLVGSAPDDRDTDASDIGGLFLLLMMATSTVYYVVGEVRKPFSPPAPYPMAHPYWSVPPSGPAAQPTPLVPLGQLQAELDELSALLHQHERPAP